MLSSLTCTLMFAGLIFAADPPKEEPTKKVPAELQGEWKLVTLKIHDEDVDVSKKQPVWVIKGEKVKYGGEDFAVITADSSTSPKVFDLSIGSPKKTFEGIYSVEKDTLKVCLNGHSDGVKERPKDFSATDNEQLRLLVFERFKPREGEDSKAGVGFAGVQIKLSEDKSEVVVADTIEGSAARKAGLKSDDVILKVGDAEVKDLPSTINTVREAKPGKELVFHIRRDGKEMDITVKVGLLPFALLADLK